MAETSSTVNINDIPERYYPYRDLLLKTAFGQIYTPETLKRTFPDEQFYSSQPSTPQPQTPQQNAPTTVQRSSAAAQPMTIDLGYPTVSSRGDLDSSDSRSLLAQMADALDAELRRGYTGTRKMASGGRLAEAASAIEELLRGGSRGQDVDPAGRNLTATDGGVSLGPGGSPIGGTYGGITVSPGITMPNIGSGTQTPPPPAPPNVTPPANNNGVISQPPPQTQPRPGAGSAGGGQTGGGVGGYTAPIFSTQQPGNFAGSQQAAAAGYNPAQYADDSVLQDLAQRLGGTAMYTNSIGTGGPPSQGMLNFGGQATMNAGLINAAMNESDPGMRKLKLQGIRDEIRQLGGTPTFKHGGVVRRATGGNLLGIGSAPQSVENPLDQFSSTTGQSSNMSGVLKPYQPYSGQRVLGAPSSFGQTAADGTFQLSNLTQSGLNALSGIPSAYDTQNMGSANTYFNTAGQQAMDAGTQAQSMVGQNGIRSTFQDTMAALQADPTKFQAGDITLGQLSAPQMDAPLGVTAPQLQTYQMGPAGRFTDAGTADSYMSPYMDAVTQQRQQEAVRNYNEQQQYRNANAVQAGAFGGSRQAVADSLANRDLMNQLDSITAEGRQSAFENAQQQYERDRAAGMTANQANLQAALGVQELGANQSLTAQQANQQAGLTAGQANLGAALNTQNLDRTSGLTAAQANQQTRLAQNQALLDAQAQADQLQQQAGQANFTNNLNALGQQTNSALATNTIGQSQADLSRLAQAMELQRAQALQSGGQQVDALTQQALDQGYQDYANQSNYPYQQINWLQSILNGTPMGYNQENIIFNKTNAAAQLGGLGTAALGALNNSNK